MLPVCSISVAALGRLAKSMIFIESVTAKLLLANDSTNAE
jgi:hypothetical protein